MGMRNGLGGQGGEEEEGKRQHFGSWKADGWLITDLADPKMLKPKEESR